MRILVIRNDKIGDLILSLPTLGSLRKSYPEAHISILVKPYTQEILYLNPDIDEVIVDNGKDFFKLLREIKDKRFDAAIVLYPNWKNALLCFLSRIPVRVGTGYKSAGILFNKRVYVHRTKVMCHETDYCLKLVEGIGAKVESKEIKIWIKDEDKEYGRRLLEKYQLLGSKPLIGVHPGCGGSALNWTISNYAQLIDEISTKYKTKVVLTGSIEEKDLIEEIISHTRTQPINLTEQTSSLGQLMGVLSCYHLFIAPSTGPMHLAAALGIKVIALFPPIRAMSPLKWGPLGKNHQVLLPHNVTCPHRRCTFQKCIFYNCMEKITTQMVLEAILDF